MAYLHTYTGLELPVYDASTPIAYGDHEIFEATLSSPDNSILRRARIGGFMGYSSLMRALDIADEEFDAIANDCDAFIPKHSWALYKDAEPIVYFSHSLLPHGYSLAMTVEIIHDLEPLESSDEIELASWIFDYYSGGKRPAVWRDARADQFQNGTSKASGKSGRWLLDLEPLFDRRTTGSTSV